MAIYFTPEQARQFERGLDAIFTTAAIRIRLCEQFLTAATRDLILRPAWRKAKAQSLARKSWWRSRHAIGYVGKRAAGCRCRATACRCR
jgi:hypothetical protein